MVDTIRHLIHNIKSTVKISSFCVAFLENINFTLKYYIKIVMDFCLQSLPHKRFCQLHYSLFSYWPKQKWFIKTLILNNTYVTFFFHFRFEITNEIPSHPAGSFHYPEKLSLPFIATFSFVKEKEYELSEVFNFNFKRNNPKNNNIDNASSKTKVNKVPYIYYVITFRGEEEFINS